MQSIDHKQSAKMERYYRLHARIYQATRWAFLFGRGPLVRRIGALPTASSTVRLLEIGCGTGHNLALLAQQYPHLQLSGIDTAGPMLAVARKKLANAQNPVLLLHQTYGTTPLPDTQAKPDIILISYCLTMINPGYQQVLDQAWQDLPAGAYIAVVDFHCSPLRWFRQWMQFNHVRMEKHLLPELEQRFTTNFKTVKSAYGGLWQYFIFVGQKR